MTAPARALHEPEEREDPRNALLDAVSDLVRRARDLDLEPQLRARLADLLPAPVPAQGVRGAKPEGDVGERLVRNAILRQALGIKAGSARSGVNRQIVENAMRIAEEEGAALLAQARETSAAATLPEARVGRAAA